MNVPICKPPQAEDFSKKAINKAVFGTAVQHPATLYPTALGIVGIFGLMVLNPSFALVVMAMGGMGLGVGSWIVNFFLRNDAIARKYTRKLYEQLDAYKQQLRQSVRTEFENLRNVDFAREYVEQGLQQFQMINKKFENMKEVLSSKLNPNELTFTTYFGTAEQVYLAVLDNLKNTALILKSIRTIDPDYIKSRLRNGKKAQKITAADQEEIETLNKRKELYEKKLEEANALLAANEKAMTELDETSAALATVKTSESFSSVGIQTAMKELSELAKRAQQYSCERPKSIIDEEGEK